MYVNIYLFEKNIKPLQVQKNNRELELLIKECILNTIRESIPIEHILQMYLDETLETDVEVEEKKEVITDKEALEKNKKAKEKKELEKIKQITAEQLKAESKANLKNTILNANKDLNDVNVLSTIKKIDSDVYSTNTNNNNNNTNTNNNELGSDSETETEPDTDNNYKLKIGKLEKSQFELDVQNLNEDPDKLDLDILDLNTEISDTESIALDIEELK